MPASDAKTITVLQPMRMLNGGDFLLRSPSIGSAADEPWARGFAGISRLSGQIAERFLFSGLWLVIACVSSIDTYLTIRFREHLYYQELNPIARYLLRVDGWEPSLLIDAKFLGSILVLGFVSALYSQNRRRGLIVTGALAGFQLGLLGYLTLL